MDTSGLQCAGWKPWRCFSTEQGRILILSSWHESWQLRGEGSCILGEGRGKGIKGASKGNLYSSSSEEPMECQWRGEHSRREGSRYGGTVGRLWAANRVWALFCEWQAKHWLVLWVCGCCVFCVWTNRGPLLISFCVSTVHCLDSWGVLPGVCFTPSSNEIL